MTELAGERKRRARADGQIRLPRQTDFVTIQYFIQIKPVMFGFSKSYVDHFSNKTGNIFRQILRISTKCVKRWMIEIYNWSQKRLGF